MKKLTVKAMATLMAFVMMLVIPTTLLAYGISDSADFSALENLLEINMSTFDFRQPMEISDTFVDEYGEIVNVSLAFTPNPYFSDEMAVAEGQFLAAGTFQPSLSGATGAWNISFAVDLSFIDIGDSRQAVLSNARNLSFLVFFHSITDSGLDIIQSTSSGIGNPASAIGFFDTRQTFMGIPTISGRRDIVFHVEDDGFATVSGSWYILRGEAYVPVSDFEMAMRNFFFIVGVGGFFVLAVLIVKRIMRKLL